MIGSIAFLVAERIGVEPGTGKLSVINMIDILEFEKFPVDSCKFVVFALLSREPSDVPQTSLGIEIAFERDDGYTELPTSAKIKVDVNFKNAFRYGFHREYDLSGLKMSGTLDVRLKIGDRLLANHKIYVGHLTENVRLN